MAYTKYSLTPANNNAAPPDGAPEGMLPSAVNDTMRDMMAQIRDVGDGIRGGTYTMTAPVITGGSINGTTIGATTASTGAFSTLSATGVTTVQAGTVSAPAITTTGDTNTGIFFPAADTIAFTEGGVEAMRIDSSGNVGIGTSSTAGAKLHIVGSTSTTGSHFVGNEGGLWMNGLSNFGSGITSDSAGTAVRLWTDGTERMRIDSSGDVGIGTSSPATRLNIVGAGCQYRFDTANADGAITVANPAFSAYAISSIDAAQHAFKIAGTERMRLDTSGNLGIGTSSPSAKLELSGGNLAIVDASTGQRFLSVANTAGRMEIGVFSSGNAYFGTTTSDPIEFYTNSTERMRIDSSGRVLVGGTAAVNISGAAQKIQAFTDGTNGIGVTQNSSGGYCFATNAASNGGVYYHVVFEDAGTSHGSITSNGTTTTYAVTSDYRLKTVIAPVTDAGTRLDALQPIEYDWNTGVRAKGFLAHQFAEVYPSSVTGEKDAVDAEGKPIYQSMQASTAEVMADLIAEIQSLRKRVAQLESK